MCARQVNSGTSADGIRGPAGSVSVRLRVHALAGVHDGLALNRTPTVRYRTESTVNFLLSSKFSAWLLFRGHS